MIRLCASCVPLATIALSLQLLAAEPAHTFPLRDGDVWVMAGDSITAQHLHSNYFEAFCFARYPQWKFAFRNSGVGGHTIPSTLARFDYDVAGWKPTVISVELGMNDKGGTPTEMFVKNMKTMVERIRGVQARPVILAASPVNNGETLAKLGGGNSRLHEYAVALKEFSAAEKVPYADQFHALLDVWGENKPRETLAGTLGTLRQLALDERVTGVEHLRKFIAAHDQSGQTLISMQGDPVHPGAPGQLMMAAALLKALGADGFVSSAAVSADGKLIEAKGCRIENLAASGDGLLFDRSDERLPFPIPDDARAVLSLDPTILELSQYTLRVTGLKDGPQQLKINGVAVATISGKDLAGGVNLTAFGPGAAGGEVNPIVAQSRAILAAVSAKEGLVGQWRGLSKAALAEGAPADLREQLAALGKKVLEADEKIRTAAQPQKLRFEISSAK